MEDARSFVGIPSSALPTFYRCFQKCFRGQYFFFGTMNKQEFDLFLEYDNESCDDGDILKIVLSKNAVWVLTTIDVNERHEIPTGHRITRWPGRPGVVIAARLDPISAERALTVIQQILFVNPRRVIEIDEEWEELESSLRYALEEELGVAWSADENVDDWWVQYRQHTGG